ELSERVVKAELDTLKAQLQPHFLFNTHNAIAGLIRSRQDTAALELLTSLSDFLRYVLDNRERDAVLFARELAFARKYLEIQQVRFQGRLEVEWTIRDHCEALRVPPLLLQPLIENAVHHGVGVGRRRSVVCVDVSRRDAQLVVEVVNSASREGVDHRGFGVGLANVTARLERLYGADYSLDLELIDAADGDARMRLRMALPLERGEDDGR
ncbi:MAG: histidine kinase, partial [Myxococcales bacterium]|nr:histidine kinase [Myxococcales bacterium]